MVLLWGECWARTRFDRTVSVKVASPPSPDWELSSLPLLVPSRVPLARFLLVLILSLRSICVLSLSLFFFLCFLFCLFLACSRGWCGIQIQAIMTTLTKARAFRWNGSIIFPYWVEQFVVSDLSNHFTNSNQLLGTWKAKETLQVGIITSLAGTVSRKVSYTIWHPSL